MVHKNLHFNFVSFQLNRVGTGEASSLKGGAEKLQRGSAQKIERCFVGTLLKCL